jgi:alginate O-acetyltransferase complex protein AlgI
VIFNSLEFVGFLLGVLVLYYLPWLRRFQTPTLILASFYFYAAQNPKLLGLLSGSILVNALLSWQIARGQRWLLSLGVVLNLALLGVFKYGSLLGGPDWLTRLPLPIGISFFTFEAIVILFDSAREPEGLGRRLSRVGLLMSFFPHLVSGPILKAQEFFPQVGPKSLRDMDPQLAFRSLTVGYFLKMVVADNLQEQNTMMDHFQGLPSVQLLAMLFAYSMQIFADFAGYSLIAIGLGALLGYRLPDNFRFPYLAASFSEFWQRWHITLSGFLRNYLYIPLGGNRHGPFRTHFNLLLVMGLGGLWHGAAWRYAVWGLMHGLALVAERLLARVLPALHGRGWRFVRRAGVFTYVSLAWSLFRLKDFEQVKLYALAMGQNLHRPIEPRPLLAVALFSLPVVLYHLSHLYYPAWLQRREHWLYALMLFLILTQSGPPGTFIYFQF